MKKIKIMNEYDNDNFKGMNNLVTLMKKMMS